MKALTLPDLVKILDTPQDQPMNTLMYACKQAAGFIKKQEVVYKKGAEFAEFLIKASQVGYAVEPEGANPAGESAPLPSTTIIQEPPSAIPGQCNIYVTGVRAVKGGKVSRIEILRILRDASGELNAAPRMTMQKANELFGNLELGDQVTLIRTVTQMEEAAEIVKDLATVGILAEIRN